MFRTEDGIWRVNAEGGFYQLLAIPSNTRLEFSPDGAWALNYDQSVVYNFSKNAEFKLDNFEGYTICCPQWVGNASNQVVVSAEPAALSGGMFFRGSLAVFNLKTGAFIVLGPELSALQPFQVSPDGKRIAYNRADVPWIYDWQTGSQKFGTEKLGLPTDTEFSISHPAWSPTGRFLAWVISGTTEAEREQGFGSIGIFDFENQTGQLLSSYEVEGLDGGRSAIYWSPDEKSIALSNGGKELLWIISVAGDNSHFIGPADQPVWSPDGHWLAYVQEGKVAIRSSDALEFHLLSRGQDPIWSPDSKALVFNHQQQIKLAQADTWRTYLVDLPSGAKALNWLSIK